MKAIIFIGLFFLGSLHSKPLSVRTGCPIAILVNADTGAVLYEKNAHKQVNPASITKLASALFALQFMDDMDQVISVQKECLIRMSRQVKTARGFADPPYWLQPDGANIALKPGEQIKLRDLLYAHIMCSANDAANVIAHTVDKDIVRFVHKMNLYFKKLGCKSTQFKNPHGLYFPGHLSTAYDFSIIASEALKHPFLASIVKEYEYEIDKTNKSASRKLRIFNRLVNPKSKFFYKKAVGLKTGFNDEAQFTLAAAAHHDGRTLVAILLQSPNDSQRFQDAIALFEAAFKEEKVKRQLFSKLENTFFHKIPGARKPVKAHLVEDVGIEYYPAEEREIHAAIVWHDLQMPVLAGQEVGSLLIETENDEIVAEYPLFAMENSSPSFFYLFRNFSRKYGLYVLAGLLVIGVLIPLRQRHKVVD